MYKNGCAYKDNGPHFEDDYVKLVYLCDGSVPTCPKTICYKNTCRMVEDIDPKTGKVVLLDPLFFDDVCKHTLDRRYALNKESDLEHLYFDGYGFEIDVVELLEKEYVRHYGENEEGDSDNE